jgi:hypothetical protein
MDLVVALAISIGTVSGIWMVIAHLLGLSAVTALMAPAWAAFIGMPLYFASGGGKGGLGKTFAANTAGSIMSMVMGLIMAGTSFLGNPAPIAIGVGLGSAIIVLYSKWPPLSYIPGCFAGCSAAFAFGVGYDISLLLALNIAMWSGAFLGFVADVWGNAMAKKTE